MNVVNGTSELLANYYGKPQKETVKALVAVKDGKPVGVAGLKIHDAKMIAFMSISDELRNDKQFRRILIQGYRKWLRLIPYRLPVFALADQCIDGAESFLKHCGFERVKGDIWIL